MSAHIRGHERGILGIDGEGFDHGSCYAYMAAADRKGVVATAENIRGLTTAMCFEFLLELPKGPLKFGFSLGYDYTHILRDLDNKSLYELCHPEDRMPERGPPKPVLWTSPDGTHYALNLLSGRFSVSRLEGHRPECKAILCNACKSTANCILWDCFKFYQSSFIEACKSWEVISKEEHDILKAMKDNRANFKRPRTERDADWMEIKRYCGLEVIKMAELATRLLQAHDDAGLKLKQYFGAGSTGAAMLDKMGARRFIRHRVVSHGKAVWRSIDYEPGLRHALACAFFGGRFEISRIGPVRHSVWSYDISSAYPYAFTFLPCLVHGHWEWYPAHGKLHGLIERAPAAVVQYELPWCKAIGKLNRTGWDLPPISGCLDNEGSSARPWGPFPFRDSEGNIIFPVTSGGGWAHKEEYLAGLRHFPNVKTSGAWVFHQDCSCTALRFSMPENYKLRCSWGKEGRGQVAKLGQNSCYGKAAQTKGRRPPYQNFVWAGMTTASCRAQVLDGMAMASDPSHILMIATDGIVSSERLTLATPKDTGTYDTIDVKSGKKKPLGGWEEKELPHGVMLIRPGIAFPFEGDFKETKARGIGKTVLSKMREEVMRRWELDGGKPLSVYRPMFFGMKSQIRKVGDEYRRGALYGTFKEQKVDVDYEPRPKRPGVAEGSTTLLSWALAPDKVSQPYKPILGEKETPSEHTARLREERLLNEDQPDLIEDDLDF